LNGFPPTCRGLTIPRDIAMPALQGGQSVALIGQRLQPAAVPLPARRGVRA